MISEWHPTWVLIGDGSTNRHHRRIQRAVMEVSEPGGRDEGTSVEAIQLSRFFLGAEIVPLWNLTFSQGRQRCDGCFVLVTELLIPATSPMASLVDSFRIQPPNPPKELDY